MARFLVGCGVLVLTSAAAAAQPAPVPDPAPVPVAPAPVPNPATTPDAAPTPAAPAPAPPAPSPAPPEELPTPAPALDAEARAASAPVVAIGGYLQPQVLVRQNDPVASDDENGFLLRRARLIATARQRILRVEMSAQIEAELAPEFQLLDAYATARAPLPAGLVLAVSAGQLKAPISRQELLSDANLMFPEKAAVASLAPGRQLGARAGLAAPVGPVWIELIGGLFDGEGRNHIHNIDENFLYTGRLEVGYGAHDRTLAESDLDGATYVIVAGSVGRNRLDSGESVEKVLLFGGDVAAGWHGASASFEYLEARHFFRGGMVEDFHANGFAASAGYLLPWTFRGGGRLEVGARVEEIDRNDTLAIAQLGDQDQSARLYTGVVSYYQRGHSLKAQLAYSHAQEIEDLDRLGRDAAYANDTVLLQITYRME